MATILITGASGLIGNALAASLSTQGHVIHRLGRRRDRTSAGSFHWDIERGIIDERCLHGVTHVVHLAGAGIADKRWTAARVKELIDSRAASARLLLKAAREQGMKPQAFISAAGIGYYGAVTTGHVFTESDPPATDTIARISVEWEAAVDEWSDVTRVVKLRTPMVLAREGGALKKLATPVRLGAGAALGSGQQWVPWIHLHDLVRLYTAALFDERYSGTYNANTGNDITNDELMRTIAKVMGKPYFLPRVPSFMLQLAFGELSAILLHGSRASNERLLHTGFEFEHPELEPALRQLLS